MYQFPQIPFSSEPPVSQTPVSESPVSNASRRRLARHLVGLPLKAIERDLVLETLASTDGNRTTSARLLGMSVRTLRKKITEYSADGVAVTPGRGGPSQGGKQAGKAGEAARRSDAGARRGFLQQDSILDDARLEQATRDALRVRLRPVTSCDPTVSSDLPENAEQSPAFGAKFWSRFWPSRLIAAAFSAIRTSRAA
jgi:DNA-binding protein Fis